MSLVLLARQLRDAMDALDFGPPTAAVYNPLQYAWAPHRIYLERFGASPKRVVFLGMNPGPWGMAQTGVPFGEVAAVRGWMGIEAEVAKPSPEHPKRPIEGFACRRSEVSGRRLWAWCASRFGTAESFFRDHLVMNYCPLVWMEETGRNRTPDKLPTAEREAVDGPCRDHLRAALEHLGPAWAVGIGGFAESKLAEVTRPGDPWRLARIPHPSPANPNANRDWAGAATRAMAEAGIWQATAER